MAETPSPSAFHGFEPPKQNWFRMPYDWVYLCAEISSVAEIKVVQYVMRHTWGYQEYDILKFITLDEFMNGRWNKRLRVRMDKGTGLSKPSVIKGLKSAVERGLLIEEADDSDKARVRKYYSLRMTSTSPNNLNETAEVGDYQAGVKDLKADVKNLYPVVQTINSGCKNSLHRTEKETLARNLEKDNNNVALSSSAIAQDVVAALISLGMSQRVSETLAKQHSPDYITEKIDYLQFKQARETDSVKRPAAWLRKAIEDNYAAPDGYISASERQLREDQENDKQRRKKAKLKAQKAHFKSVEQQQKGQTEQKVERIEQLRQKYQTAAEQDQLWNLVISQLSELGLPAIMLKSVQLLQIEKGRAILYPPNAYVSNVLNQQTTKRKIEKVISSLIGRPVVLEILDCDNPKVP